MPDATVDKIVAAIRRSIGARGEKIESHFRNSLARIPHTSVGPDLFNGVKGLDKIVIANATDTEKFQNVMSDDVQRWKKILGGDAPIEIHRIEADHATIVRRPAVVSVGSLLHA